MRNHESVVVVVVVVVVDIVGVDGAAISSIINTQTITIHDND
jgi:hypothetical protein